MATDYSVRFNYSPCLHRHIVTVTTGGRHFSQGEVCDDIRESLLCLDCMEVLSESEIRGRWNGAVPEDKYDPSQEVDDVDF
jgi:hypothetical protein